MHKEDAGQRLDVFVVSKYAQLNRSTTKTLIGREQILVNGSAVKSGYKLKQGDGISFTTDIDDLSNVQDINLEIFYEDDDCIVLNKPAGVLTHSKGEFSPEGTVASFIANKTKGFNKEDNRAGIVHRLDRATSGVILCAKNPESQKYFQKQFSTRKVKKTYIAVVVGDIEPETALIDIPIARNSSNPKQFTASADGKSAQTKYEVTDKSRKYTKLTLMPKTGRTHQLRVHLKHIGKPIVGDVLYGGEPFERLLLHARELGITLHDKTDKTFVAPEPEIFHTVMDD